MHFKIAQPQNGHEIQKAHEKLDKMEYYGVIHLNWKKDLKQSSGFAYLAREQRHRVWTYSR